MTYYHGRLHPHLLVSASQTALTICALGLGLFATSAAAQPAAPPADAAAAEQAATPPSDATAGEESVTTLQPPDPAQADADTDEQIVITGSLLRRTNTETSSPVTILTAEELTSGGITNISDAIRSVSADSAGSISTGFQNGFSAGGSAVSLRGLGVSSTLVLIDGLRSTNYALSDDGHNSYTDLNTIPFSAIERIEVLKDGASSLYGADAVGGVVNIIMRKQFTGVMAGLEGGITQYGDGGRYRANVTGGVGDYESSGWNLWLNAEFQRDTPVFNKNRGFPFNTYDLSSIGGLDENSFDSSLLTATTNAVVVRTTQSDLNNPLSGGILTAEQAAGAAFATYTTLNLNCSNGSYTVTTTAARGTGCKHDNAFEQGQIKPWQQRYSASGRLSFRLGDDVEGYLTGSWSRNEVFVQSRGGGSGKAASLGARAIRNNQPFGASPALSSSNPGIVLPVYVCSAGVNCATAADRHLNPNNPYAAAYANDPKNGAARIFYLFGDIPFNIRRDNRVLRGTAGLNGSFGGGFDWRIDAVAAKSNFVATDNGYPDVQGLLKAINTGSYNFVNPELNSAAVREQIAPTLVTRSHTALYAVDASISKTLAELAGGPLQAVIGGQIRRESLTNNSITKNQATYGAPTASAFGKHTITAAFFEVSAPLMKQLELNFSGRYDHYSEGFSHFSPKVAAKFTPIRQLAFRGTYERGFRAPNFAENNPASQFAGFSSVTPSCAFVLAHGGTGTTSSCNRTGILYAQAYSSGQALTGNPDLKPELSRSFTLGTIFQPVPWFSITADYYNIRKTGVIVSAPLLGAARTAYFNAPNLEAAKAAVAAIGPGYSVNTVDAVDPSFPNALPRVLIINGPYVNAGSVDTSGIDVTATARFRLGANTKFTSRLEVTDIFKYNLSPGGGAPVQRYVGTMGPYELSSGAGTPKWRGMWQNSLDLGSVVLTGTAYYVSRIKNVAADEGASPELSCQDNLYKSANLENFCYIKSFVSVDANISFRAGENFDFYLNVMNALNTRAPIAPSSYSGINYLPSWHHAGVIGRTFSAGASFKF